PLYSLRAAILSGFNKLYPFAGYNENVPVGQADTAMGAFGPIDPAFDTTAIVNFCYFRGGGSYGLRWWTFTGGLVNYMIPVIPDVVGKTITVLKSDIHCVVNSATVGGGGISVSTPGGAGGFSAILG